MRNKGLKFKYLDFTNRCISEFKFGEYTASSGLNRDNNKYQLGPLASCVRVYNFTHLSNPPYCMSHSQSNMDAHAKLLDTAYTNSPKYIQSYLSCMPISAGNIESYIHLRTLWNSGRFGVINSPGGGSFPELCWCTLQFIRW